MSNRACSLVAAGVLLLLSSSAWAAGPFAVIGRKEAKTLVDPARYDKPTIIALWSSTCSYCKRNLALFAELVKAFPGVNLITVAAESPMPGLDKHLDKLAVPGERLAYGDDVPEAIADALNPKWRGELPHTLFFDGHGNKAAVSGVVNRESALHLLGLSRKPSGQSDKPGNAFGYGGWRRISDR